MPPLPSRLHGAMAIGEAVIMAAEALAGIASEQFKRASVPRGTTLRPGVDTPLWLALVAAIRPLLRKYGAKALLGHQIGVHRGRITEYFVQRTAMPDAERTLLLLEWLGRQSVPTMKAEDFVRITNSSKKSPAASRKKSRR